MNKKSVTYKKTASLVLFLLTVAILCLTLPAKVTIVSPDLENVQKYLAALELQKKKTALQESLPGHEEVLDIYDNDSAYFQVANTCGWDFSGDCVKIMTGPGTTYEQAYMYYEYHGTFPALVRTGQVFAMSALIKSSDGSLWYKINFDNNATLFPERIRGDWYVPANHFTTVDFTPINPQNDAIKKIIITLSTQELQAFEGDQLFLKTKISSGQDRFGLPTSTGTFDIFRKTPMTIMEGPLPNMISLITPENIIDFEYTLFVPYAMAFDQDYFGTSFIHEAYWHNGFGTERSHGCINVSYQDAATLYNWTPDPSVIKIPVIVQP